MDYFDPLAASFWLTVGAAVLCGVIVGGERQFRGKTVGIRTSVLVCLSTTIFVRLGMVNVGDIGDPTRVLGQLVTGVGFLGAGVMFTREGIVTGVTTAAVIWILAAIGATNGLGYATGALALSGVTVTVLLGVEFLEKVILAVVRWFYPLDSLPRSGD